MTLPAAAALKPTASFVKQSNGLYLVSFRCRLGGPQHECAVSDAIARSAESTASTRVLLKYDDGCEASVSRDELHRRHTTVAVEAYVVDTAPDAAAAVVLPGMLYVGSQDAAANQETLASNGIVNVLNVGPQIAADADTAVVRRMHAPLLDVPETQLPTGSEFESLRQFIESGPTLVHCNAGVSRSVSICILFLLETGRCTSVDDALAMIRINRPAARPNDGFLKQLKLRQAQITQSTTTSQ
jgi:atypical dual specificity phosphatase